MELREKRKQGSSIAYLMSPEVALNRRNVFAKGGTQSFSQAVALASDGPLSASEGSAKRPVSRERSNVFGGAADGEDEEVESPGRTSRIN